MISVVAVKGISSGFNVPFKNNQILALAAVGVLLKLEALFPYQL